jgi:hypothetical protein
MLFGITITHVNGKPIIRHLKAMKISDGDIREKGDPTALLFLTHCGIKLTNIHQRSLG